MLRYVSKFFLEILPSVVATVVGAYIVNHYISPRSGAEAPKAAAISHVDSAHVESSSVDAVQPAKGSPAGVTSAVRELAPRDARTRSADKAKAQAEKVQVDRALAEKGPDAGKDPAKAEPESRHFFARDKAIDKPPQPAPAETASIAPTAPDEHPDAAELARAALERLRVTEPARPAEAAPPVVVHEAPHEPAREIAHVNMVTAAPPPADVRSTVPPLPPPVSVSAPVERTSVSSGAPSESQDPPARYSQADRPVPPADIPGASEPVDLQGASPPVKKKSVTDEVFSAARSVFQHVVPQ